MDAFVAAAPAAPTAHSSAQQRSAPSPSPAPHRTAVLGSCLWPPQGWAVTRPGTSCAGPRRWRRRSRPARLQRQPASARGASGTASPPRSLRCKGMHMGCMGGRRVATFMAIWRNCRWAVRCVCARLPGHARSIPACSAGPATTGPAQTCKRLFMGCSLGYCRHPTAASMHGAWAHATNAQSAIAARAGRIYSNLLAAAVPRTRAPPSLTLAELPATDWLLWPCLLHICSAVPLPPSHLQASCTPSPARPAAPCCVVGCSLPMRTRGP